METWGQRTEAAPDALAINVPLWIHGSVEEDGGLLLPATPFVPFVIRSGRPCR
jgi:hypothetical protein